MRKGPPAVRRIRRRAASAVERVVAAKVELEIGDCERARRLYRSYDNHLQMVHYVGLMARAPEVERPTRARAPNS